MQRLVIAACSFALVAGRSLRAGTDEVDALDASHGLAEFGSAAASMAQPVAPAPAPAAAVPDSEINAGDELQELSEAAERPVPLSRRTRSGIVPYGVKPCIDFVRDRLAHGYVGELFLKEMASTCGPPIGSGIAQIPYQRACSEVKRITAGHANSMGTVDIEAFCTTVMDAFQSYKPALGR